MTTESAGYRQRDEEGYSARKERTGPPSNLHGYPRKRSGGDAHGITYSINRASVRPIFVKAIELTLAEELSRRHPRAPGRSPRSFPVR